MSERYFTYMLRCVDDTLYTGFAVNVEKRIEVHNKGKGSKYTRARLPVTLAYWESFSTKQEALAREREIKKLSRGEKIQLISQSNRENQVPT